MMSILVWTPVLRREGGPLYCELADAIGAAIESGELAAGARLPPQRELADRLGIGLSTVARGYGEAERRGILEATVGRGTFVRGLENRGPALGRPEVATALIDLGTNALAPAGPGGDLGARMARLLARRVGADLYAYTPPCGLNRHREAGVQWLASQGVESTPDRVVVTGGVQQGLHAILATIAAPGDTLIVEDPTYSGVQSLARLLGLRLVGLPMDEEGLPPEALRRACRRERPAAIYTIPTLQNPMSCVMSRRRREQIVAVAAKAGIPIVEDDAYGFLVPRTPRLASLSPDVYYLAGTAKSLAPTLRVGFARVPTALVPRIEATISATIGAAPAIMAEVVAGFFQDGTARAVIDWKRREVMERQRLAARVFSGLDYGTHPMSPHGWLRLPAPWTTGDFVAQAERCGVRVAPAEAFSVCRERMGHAVRICVGPPRTRAVLEMALQRLADLAHAGPSAGAIVV